jgi:hypothetical protein
MRLATRLRPFFFRNATGVAMSETLNKNIQNSINNYFICANIIMLFKITLYSCAVQLIMSKHKQKLHKSNCRICGFGGLVVSILASGIQVRGFKPGRSRRIFRGEKILSMPSFGGEVKPSFPCRRLRHVKEPYNYRGSRNCRLN